MSFNKYKKRKNVLNNFIKYILFGKGLQQKKILFGKARGIKMFINPTYKVQRIIGADEREIQSLFVHFAKKCNYFFDVGSSDGYYSLLYKKYNPSGEVYLFDTDEKFEEVQKNHFAINKINSGFHMYFKIVSDKNDDAHICLDNFKIKLDSFKIKITALFKIDVEGGELMVLGGMHDTLINCNCYLIIETHSRQLERDCINFLLQKKYQTRIIKNAWWRIILGERRPLAHNRWLVAYNKPLL